MKFKKKFPFWAMTYRKTFNKKIDFLHKRAAIFATYNEKCLIDDNIIEYLTEIKRHVDFLIVVADNPIVRKEVKKLKNIADAVLFQRHREYDFGSYKRGYLKLKKLNVLNNIEKLLLFNDSVIYEHKKLDDVFEKSDNFDFYGILSSIEGVEALGKFNQNKHIQSWFVMLGKKIFNTEWFNGFITNIQRENFKEDIIAKYELGLSKLIKDRGFEINSYYPLPEEYNQNPDLLYANPKYSDILFTKKRFLQAKNSQPE